MMKQRNKYYDESYQRLDKNSKSDSESGEETELFIRNKSPRREIPSVEKLVEDGDTLQSLAIRYRCTIEDLKRLNNIHNDNEIFAKPSIKIPHRPFSMALAGVHLSGSSSPDVNNTSISNSLIDVDSLNNKLDFVSNNGKKTENNLNQIIFNSHVILNSCERLDKDDVDETCDFSAEEVKLLPERRDIVTTDPVVAKLNWSGADCDIPWVALIVCTVILIFALPLIYVFYIAEHIEEYHHHHS